MACTVPNTGLKHCYKSQNQMLQEALDLFKGNLRKAMKLLCKQYHITEIMREGEDEFADYGRRVTVRRKPFIIRYFNPKEPEEVFEWTIEEHEIKN